MNFTCKPIFAYWAFARLFPSIFNCFAHQTKQKENQNWTIYVQKQVTYFDFFVFFVTKVVCIANYFTGHVWMMNYVADKKDSIYTVKKAVSHNSFISSLFSGKSMIEQ